MRVSRCAPAIAILLLCVLSLGASIPAVPTNTWQQGGALSTARTGATATLMADGRILIVGGKDGNGNALETAEVLNPDGTLAPVPSMLTQRYGHSAILLHDGNVLVAGGHTSGGGVVNSAELFDPVANTWRWASNTMADPRADFALSQLIDGNILVAGGDNGSGPLSGVEKFDLLTEAFKYIGHLNTARKAHAASVLKDGRVLITGGSAVAQDGSTIALNSTEIYDPNSTVLSAGPVLNAARYAHSSTTLIDGTVLLAGGNNGSADLASLEVFDPVANSMTTSSATLSTPRSGHVALLLPNNNHVLIAGGTSGGTALSSTELYRSWTSSIVTNPAMSAAREGAAASALQLDGTAMVAGGSNLGSTEFYGFATIKTDASDYPPGTNVHITGSGWVPGETVALTLIESPLIDTHGPYAAVADANGNISDNSFTTDAHDMNIAFALTAVGSKSQAQNTFTDGDFGTVTVGPQSPTPVVPGGSAQYAITVGLADNTCTVNSPTISNLPANATGVFSAYSISGSTYSSTLTVSTTATTPLGSPTFIVTVTASPVMGGHGSNCSGNKTVTQNGTLAVALGATTTTVSSSSNPSDSGSPVTFTATVTPNVTGSGQTPTGSVTFKDGSTTLGSAVAINSSGVATLTTSALTAGSHSITAAYGGNSSFAASTSSALTQTVRAAAVFSSLPASTSISYGQASITVSGHVANAANTVLASSPDTVTVTINNTPLSIPIQTTTGNFSGTFATSSIPASSTAYTIQYSFAGDANLTSASDSSKTLTVSKVTPTIAWSTPAGISYGTALSATQLNATATYQSGGSPAAVAGTFTYTPAAGAVLSAGSQTLSVHFVPADATDFATPVDKTVTLNVQTASLTPSITASNKTYDGTTAATFTCSLSGVVGADDVSCTGGTAVFASAAAGTGTTVTATGLQLTGTKAANYTLASTTATTTANIIAKSLTISGVTAADKVYDGTLTATLNAASATLQEVVAADASLVTLQSGTKAGLFADKNVGVGKAVTASGFTLLGASAGNYTLAQPTGLTASITAKPLSVSGVTASDKVYDATTNATLNTASAAPVGVVSGETITLVATGATGTFSDKNVGTGKTVTVAGLTLASTAGSTNYSLTQPTATASITAKTLTVSGVTAASKTYDGTTSATLNTATASLVGVVANDVVTLSSTSATGTFANKNVGTGKTVTIADLAIGGTDAGNYLLTQPTATADITAKSLTPTLTVQNKVYDGTASATIATQSLTGVVATDVVSLVAGTATFSDKNIGVGKTVSISSLSLSGADAGNYSVSNSATATADITPRALHVTATGSSKVYDGNTVATVTLHDDRVNGDIFTDSNTSATFLDKNVGAGKTISVTGISIAGADANNYSPVNASATATADITARGLTVSATADDKIYDGNTTATAHLSDNRVSGDSLAEAYTAAAFSDKTVGVGKAVSITGISISGGDAGNYSLSATSTSATASITARPLHVTATGVSRKYDGTTTATVTLSDDRLAGDVFTDSYSTASFADKNVGTGKLVSVAGISIAGADSANYAANATTTTTASITQRLVTISAVADSKTYDATVTSSAKPTISGDGVAPGDTASSSQTFDTKNVGTGKTLTATGTIQDGNGGANYQVTFAANHSGSITPRPLTVSATGVNKQYDGSVVASVTLTDDRVAGDVFTDSYSGASFADKNVGTNKPISVAGISISGSDAANYGPVNSTATASADITARVLTVSASGVNKTYDGNTTAAVLLSDDRLAGDSLTESYSSATFDNKTVGTGKTVSVSGISVSGSDAGNYNLANTTASTTANINARHLTVAATGIDKTYDGNTTAAVTLSDDRLAGDALTDSYSSASFSDKNVGSGKTVTVTGIAISGADAANYSANPNTATTASISSRKLTVTASGVAKVYDGTTLATVTLSDDRVSGDVFSDADASATFSDRNVGTAKIVSVSGITISGIDAANYGPINATATTAADITPRSLTVSAIASNKPYDGTTSASVTLNDNRVPGDALTDAFTGATFSDKNAGVAKTVTVTGISISGVDAGNYVLGNTTASAAADITARAIEVTAASDSKTYDATTVSSKSPSITAGSLAAGDSATYTQIFDSKNAGTRSLLPSIVIADGNNGHNYSVVFHNVNGTINPLTITGSITVLDKTYDGSTAATINTRTLSGVLANDVVSYTGGTATFSDSNAGANKTVTVGGLYLAGSDAGNYTVNSTATTIATIDKANQQISWSAPAPIVFGTSLGNTQLNATVTGVQGGTAPEGLSYTPPAGTILGVGTRQLRVDAASTINYNAASLTVPINVTYSTGACAGDLGHSILQPINADGSSTFKQGSTVPAKFRVCDVAGHSIGTAGVVASFNLVQTISGTVSTTVDEAVTSTTPDSSFRWDSTAQQWIFNVSTKPLSAQTTYVYSIGLNDGSTILFRYGLPR